ncbi:DNA methyltransferase [Tokyovirus A1]|uniref:DNA methyltransferase n=1 Tax=Tokyovirus A1 TaxID=1826170 RepID=UPI0007A9804C|nr:DNA methyltransferase [Tokyovirus A1]BAU79890.1 Dam-like adenine-specific DNA methylase [Tokyovirus A1]
MSKPPLKWVGGKSQILENVLELFPKTIKNYYEPFVGGGSVLLGLLRKVRDGEIRVKGKIYVSDKNENLIFFYKNIQKRPEKLIESLEDIMEKFRSCKEMKGKRDAKTEGEALLSQEAFFYWTRKNFNTEKKRKAPETSAMFLFLNKTCFRGVYREGPNGYNVPFGHYKNPQVFEKEHILEISKLLAPVKFSVSCFSEALENVGTRDFVYLDPPYVPEKANSFVGYTCDGFSAEQHAKLFTLCKEGEFKFLLSNSCVPLVLDEFSDFEIVHISCRRSVNSKNPSAKSVEVLIKNF